MSVSEQEKQYWRSKNFTLRGRIFYPHLLQTRMNRKKTREIYDLVLAWPITDQVSTVQQIAAFLAEGKRLFYPQIPDPNFIKPIKKWGVYQRKDGKPLPAFFENCYWFNAASGAKFPPSILDRTKQQVINPAEIYSGRNAAVNFSFYGYGGDSYGISVNLNAVMLLEGGEQVQSAAGVSFDDAFGAFAEDMGVSAQSLAQTQVQGSTPFANPNPQINQGGSSSFM